MARTLTYRLSDPGFTIYHRAALGGLAATIHAWGKNPPEGVSVALTADEAALSWSEDVGDREAVQRILTASFGLTKEKMIDLIGHQIPPERDDLRVAIHNGLCATFLQHPKMRPGEKAARFVSVRDADADAGTPLSYKPINSYAHQAGKGTGILERKGDVFAGTCEIPQSVVPGAMKGASPLQAPPQEVFLLLYLMVGSAVFLLRPRTWKEKAQACVIVPDVVDLKRFARNLGRIAASGEQILSGSYLGRIAGGLEEAALRFLLDLETDLTILAGSRSIAGVQAIAMGKVSWDKNQVNRSFNVRLRGTYPEFRVFERAQQHLGRARLLTTKKGEAFAVPQSPVPELVAANLGADRHWCSGFRELVHEKKDFSSILFQRKGLAMMREAIKSTEDQAVIDTFQSAWSKRMGALGERSRREGVAFERLIEVERERLRNAILRAKTGDALANLFLRFCAEATHGGTLAAMRDHGPIIRKFLFDPRNADRLQNLLLFALVSYAGDTKRAATNQDTISKES